MRLEDIKVDRVNKTLTFPDGVVVPISKEREREILRTPQAQEIHEKTKERTKRAASSSSSPIEALVSMADNFNEAFLGNPAETIGDYAKGTYEALTGEGREDLGFLDKIEDVREARSSGRKEAIGEMAEKHPVSSGVGKVAGTVGEMAALSGVPAAAALPIMGAAHSDTSMLDPAQKAKEIGSEALQGYALDKVFGGLSRIAGNRGNIRTAQGNIARVEGENLAETQRAAQATEADRMRFSQETAAREGNVLKQKSLQDAENQAAVLDTEKRMNRVAHEVGVHPISAGTVGVEEFIENVVDRSANSGTSEANSVSKFLRNIFKGNAEGKLTGDHLKRGIVALDEKLMNSEGVSKEILSDFRAHFLKTFPEKMADSYVAGKWSKKIMGDVDKSLEPFSTQLTSVLHEPNFSRQGSILDLSEGKLGRNFPDSLKKEMSNAVKEVLSETEANFLQGIKSKDIKERIAERIREGSSYKKLEELILAKTSPNSQLRESILKASPVLGHLSGIIEKAPSKVGSIFEEAVGKYHSDISNNFSDKLKSVKSNLSNFSKGPNATPQIPLPPPVPHTPVTPNLQEVPVMPQQTGVYGRLAGGLESMNLGNLARGARGIARPRNAIGAGVLGHAAHAIGVPLAAVGKVGIPAAFVMKGLTSPTATGAAVRGGLNAVSRIMMTVQGMAEKYPSYHDGIVEDPQERRSLTKEIELDRDMPIEQKAIMQSKVNRGRPIDQRI